MVIDLSCHHTVHHSPFLGGWQLFLQLYTSFHVPTDLGLSSIPGLSFLSLALDPRSALFLSSAGRSFHHQRPVNSSSYLHIPDHFVVLLASQVKSLSLLHPPSIHRPLGNSVQIAVGETSSRPGFVRPYQIVIRLVWSMNISLLRGTEFQTEERFRHINAAHRTSRRSFNLLSKWRRRWCRLVFSLEVRRR
jgi:hypothetical protein